MKHYPNDSLRILWYFSKWPVSRLVVLRNVPENWGNLSGYYFVNSCLVVLKIQFQW